MQPQESSATLLKPEETRDGHHEEHCVGRRFFAGPLPKAIALAHVSAELEDVTENAAEDSVQGPSQQEDATDAAVAQLVRSHGQRIFEQLGGSSEEWGPLAARSLRQRLRDRVDALQNSEWRKAFALRRSGQRRRSLMELLCGRKSSSDREEDETPLGEWVGNSFEIGELLGVYMFSETPNTQHSKNLAKSSRHSASTAFATAIEQDPEEDLTELQSPPLISSAAKDACIIPQTELAKDATTSATVTTPSQLLEPPKTPDRVKSGPSVHWDSPGSKGARETASSFVTAPERPQSPVSGFKTDSRTGPSLKPERKDTPSASNGGNFLSSSQQLISVQAQVDDSAESETNGTNPDRKANSSTASLAPFLPGDHPQENKASRTNSFSRALRPSLKRLSLSSRSRKLKGKGKAVHYDDELTGPNVTKPATPAEVLARAPTDVRKSSAEAADALQSEMSSNGIILRDRMLVRAYYCQSAQELSKKKVYDENEIRYTRGLQELDWGEFLVIWRGDRIELYKDFKLPCRERLSGHKKLKFVIRLRQPGTRFAVFSLVDLSFSLLCESHSATELVLDKKRARKKEHSSEGVDIFVLKPRTKSRSADWIWKLWTRYFGELPRELDIKMPLLDRRLRIKLPPLLDPWAHLTHSHVVDMCSKTLGSLEDWNLLMKDRLTGGQKLQLCWRANTTLDWIWLGYDVDGQPRNWEVVYGLALSNVNRPQQLELRIAQHYPTHLRDKTGIMICEPEAIEGYVYSSGPLSKMRSLAYLTTHDGYLFLLRSADSFPPLSPAALALFMRHNAEDLQGAELARQRGQIMNSRGFWDLRDIIEVRHASSPIHRHTQDVVENGDDVANGGEGVEIDVRTHTRQHRSFELVTSNGQIHRFEVLSRSIASVWVSRLRQLIDYWNQKHVADTRTELDLLRELDPEKSIISRVRRRSHHLTLSHSDEGTFAAGAFWNWCVIDGCRAILKGGHLHTKEKLRAQYSYTQLVLVTGHLLIFNLDRSDLFHRRIGAINLLDAYAVSGYYAASMLPRREFDPDAPPQSKFFIDGLATSDLEEDVIFLLWYRAYAMTQAKGDGVSTFDFQLHSGQGRRSKYEETLNSAPIPELEAKPSLLICRARSKLERDAWCWAINCEIERLSRTSQSREVKARDQGSPVSFNAIKDK